jgi:Flp pilus assembly protein CpaB
VPVAADTVYPGLRPGDAVAVLATSNKGKPDSKTVTLLERALVYDVSMEPARIAIGNNSGDEMRGLSNVTLVVPRSQAEQVAHALVNADLTLALLSAQGSASQTPAP